MRKRIFPVLCVIVLMSVLPTSALARGAVKLSSVDFSLGSLIADGTLTGLGMDDVLVNLTASGIPVVICTNQGGNQSPGQNPSKVSASGQQSLFGTDPVRKNGKSPFGVETSELSSFLSGTQGGCPNDNWTATIDFVYWTDATISIYSLDTGELLTQQSYTCVTTRDPDSVSCTPVP